MRVTQLKLALVISSAMEQQLLPESVRLTTTRKLLTLVVAAKFVKS